MVLFILILLPNNRYILKTYKVLNSKLKTSKITELLTEPNSQTICINFAKVPYIHNNDISGKYVLNCVKQFWNSKMLVL
jgi:hypothetical protein